MDIQTRIFEARWNEQLPRELDSERTVVVAFGDPSFGANAKPLLDLRAAFPKACIIGCSTAGEIHQARIHDDAIGFYGDNVRVTHGSKGGWDIFGPERRVTKSSGNVLYELDGKPALKLYKDYLGERAKGLPATALLFPLAVRAENGSSKQLV